ncbi:MAG: DUF3822 family protein [Bacteroidales bacterium]|nr:DUF3822 family protein [Bacteroidales bacterium]
MNTHLEYCALQQGDSLLKDAIKTLAIYEDGFYFFIHHNKTLLYSFCGSGEKDEIDLDKKIFNLKPEFNISSFDKIFALPKAFVPTPKRLANSFDNEQLFKMLYSTHEKYEIVSSQIENYETTIISAFDINNLSRFGINNTSNIIDIVPSWLNKIKLKSEKEAHAIIFPFTFVIAIFNEGKLQLLNFFNYTDKNDFLYYFIGAVKSVNLELKDVAVSLCGEINPASIIVRSLELYFSNIEYEVAAFNVNEEEQFFSSIFFPLV